jgi:hypothetical protein
LIRAFFSCRRESLFCLAHAAVTAIGASNRGFSFPRPYLSPVRSVVSKETGNQKKKKKKRKKQWFDGMTSFCRASRSSIKNKWLPQIDLDRMTMNFIPQSLLDDLKLFADAMLHQLGDSYFLYTTGHGTVKNVAEALPREGDWKSVARELIASSESVTEEASSPQNHEE